MTINGLMGVEKIKEVCKKHRKWRFLALPKWETTDVGMTPRKDLRLTLIFKVKIIILFGKDSNLIFARRKRYQPHKPQSLRGRVQLGQVGLRLRQFTDITEKSQ